MAASGFGASARVAWLGAVEEQRHPSSPTVYRTITAVPPVLPSPQALQSPPRQNAPGASYLDAEERARALAIVAAVGGGWRNRVDVLPLCSAMLSAGFPEAYTEVLAGAFCCLPVAHLFGR